MMSMLLAILFFRPINIALAAPVQNLTALNTVVAPSWVDDPAGRGTWNLLYSCVFTLTLCVWTSIHLNVPALGETTVVTWRRKWKWVVIALLAPEAVVFAAFQQWLAAFVFLKELNRLADEASPKVLEVSNQTSCLQKLI
jgi:hypothetical protein